MVLILWRWFNDPVFNNRHYKPPTEWVLREQNRDNMAGMNLRFGSVSESDNAFWKYLIISSQKARKIRKQRWASKCIKAKNKYFCCELFSLIIIDYAITTTTIFFSLNKFIFVDWFSTVKRILRRHRENGERRIKNKMSAKILHVGQKARGRILQQKKQHLLTWILENNC